MGLRRIAAGFGLAAVLVIADSVLGQVPQQEPRGQPVTPGAPRRDPANAAAFAGRYRCIWTSPDGFVFECELQLRNANATDLEGRIQWTLMRSGRPDLQAKVGKGGSE